METIICAGPVIIENGKVLLNKEKKEYGITPWFFPGGAVEDFDASLEDACRREAKEEVGIDVEIIKPLNTIETKRKGKKCLLHHFLAKRIGKIKPGKGVVEWGWFDIKNLPENCAPNVYEIVNVILNSFQDLSQK